MTSHNETAGIPNRTATLGICGAITGLLLLSLSAQAQQTVQVRSLPVRVHVADISGKSTVVTNFLDLGGTYASPVNFNFSGLPTGASGSLDATTFTADGGANFTLNTTNVPQGEYLISLEASGGASSTFLLPLQSGRMWAGETNVAQNWGSPSSWFGGIPPGASDDVIFGQVGAHTNTAAILCTSVVEDDYEISSLQFSQTNNGPKFHTIQIAPGKTLSVTGEKGFRLVREWTTLGSEMEVYFSGEQGKLVVSNQNANFVSAIENQRNHRMDFTGLGNLVIDVNRIALGDYTAYPNYDTLKSNGFSGNATFLLPRRFTPTLRLARTNIIKAAYQDPTGFTNTPARKYALTLGNNELAGTSQACNFQLGITNAFFLDSLCFAGFGAQGFVNFLPGFATNNPVAVFRGIDGGRMSCFTLGDSGGPDRAGSNTKMTADFGAGTVDALVDKLYISRDRQASSGGGYNTDCTLAFGRGVFDVNTAVLGFQENPGQTNRAYARGNINITNVAVLKINNSLELGYTTEDAGNAIAEPQNNRGTVTVRDNAVAMVNRVLVGGVTKVSAGNQITLNQGSLILSNTIAGPDCKLGTLAMQEGSTLTLHVDCARTEPYIYVTNITTSGALNRIRIASVLNLDSVEVPLITFDTGSPIFAMPIMPPGINGGLSVVGNQVLLVLNTNAPKQLRWQGNVSSTWDLQTENWQDLSTMSAARFSIGDEVIFDEAAANKTINLSSAATLMPGKVTMTNTSPYVFTGSGSLVGSATIHKWGTGLLSIEAPTTLSAEVNQGSLFGATSGSLGAALVAEGATMNFAGPISSGVTVGGLATCSGTVGGATVLLSPSGSLTNLGQFSTTLSMQEGTVIHNANSFNVIGNGTIVSNSVFINAGTLSGERITVNGTLQDMGMGTITMHSVAGTEYLLTIGRGGLFIPGGSGIGTTMVTSDGSCSGATCFPGRVQFASGSTNVFKINSASSPQNTVLYSGYMDFGPSQNTPQFNGGTLKIMNLGPAFSAGQSFKLFGNDLNQGVIFPTGAATNSYPVMDPPAPGPGLIWDLSQLRPDGIIRIKSVAVAPTDLNFAISFLETISTNVPPVTNNFILTQLSWPAEYTGWRLEQQANDNDIGLSTNWTTVFQSVWTNDVVVTNSFNTNGSAFFRLVYP